MRSTLFRTSLAVATLLVIAAGGIGAQQGRQDTTMNMKAASSSAETQEKIRQAMQAAPPEVSAKAAIMDWPEKDGTPMKQLRAGTNGWTCMPSSPGPADPAGHEDPMCGDRSFAALLDAWTTRSDPRVSTVGIAYMLRGDKGASNSDPFAMAATPTNNWIVSPAHIMVVIPNPQQLDAFPTDPDAGGPWVMWKGTKYAHLMVPTASMPEDMTMATRPMPAK